MLIHDALDTLNQDTLVSLPLDNELRMPLCLTAVWALQPSLGITYSTRQQTSADTISRALAAFTPFTFPGALSIAIQITQDGNNCAKDDEEKRKNPAVKHGPSLSVFGYFCSDAQGSRVVAVVPPWPSRREYKCILTLPGPEVYWFYPCRRRHVVDPRFLHPAFRIAGNDAAKATSSTQLQQLFRWQSRKISPHAKCWMSVISLLDVARAEMRVPIMHMKANTPDRPTMTRVCWAVTCSTKRSFFDDCSHEHTREGDIERGLKVLGSKTDHGARDRGLFEKEEWSACVGLVKGTHRGSLMDPNGLMSLSNSPFSWSIRSNDGAVFFRGKRAVLSKILQQNCSLAFCPGDTVVMSLDRLSGEFSAAVISVDEMSNARTSEERSFILQDAAMNRLQRLGKIARSEIEREEGFVPEREASGADKLLDGLFPAISLLTDLKNHVVEFHEIKLLHAEGSIEEQEVKEEVNRAELDPPVSPRRPKPATAEKDSPHIRMKLWTSQTNRLGAQHIALASEPGAREQFFRDMSSFSEEADLDLVRLLNTYTNDLRKELGHLDGLRLQTHEISLEAVPLDRDTVLINYPTLWGFGESTLRSRMHVIHALNRAVRRNMGIFDWTEAFRAKADRRPPGSSNASGLGARLLQRRGLIYTSTKMEVWTQALNLTMQTSGDSLNPNAGLEFGVAPCMRPSRYNKSSQLQVERRPSITINRLVDFNKAPSSRGTSDGKSVMQQTIQEFGYGQVSPIGLRQRDRAFHVYFEGERSVDVGGPYREVLTQIVADMEKDNVLVPTPNNKGKTGTFQGCLVPNPHVAGDSSSHVLKYTHVFVGQIIGIALRTKNPIVLNMPPLIWKLLVGQRADREDLRGLDLAFVEQHDAVLREEIEEVGGAKVGAAGALPVNGKRIALLEQGRLDELSSCTTAMRQGIATICPLRLVELFSWNELEFLVCRSADIDVQELRGLTRYKGGLSENHPSVVLLWRVLEGFTQSEKVRFLRFVSGRARLSSNFVLTIVPLGGRRRPGAQPLPAASTCFSILELPTWPHSVEELREKLLYAVSHCQAMDGDA